MGRRRLAQRRPASRSSPTIRISSSARRSSGISRASSRRRSRSRAAPFPALPLVLLGQSDRIAWGLTTSDTDAEDLFVETVDPTDPTRYLTPDGPKPFLVHDETIHVKDAPDVTLHIRATRHGPVISDVDSDLAALAGPGKAIALAFTGLGDRDTTAEALMRVNVARNWDEFLDALKRLSDADPEFRLRRRRRRHRLHQPRPAADAQVGRRARARRRRLGRRGLDRRDDLRPGAAAPQSRRRVHLQRQQRDRRPRQGGRIRPRLGRDVPRPPHPAVLRRQPQAEPRSVGDDAGRPPRARLWRPAAVPQARRAERRARAAGAGAARRLERRDGQGPARAADLHGLRQGAAPHHAGREDRPVDERERAVRRRDAHRAAHRPSRMVRRAGPTRSGLPRDARRAPSTRASPSWCSATAPT